MHISEALYKLKQLPPDATVTAQHLVAFLEAITPLIVDKATGKLPASSGEQINIEDLQLVDEKKVAEILNISIETVRSRRKMRLGPDYIKDPSTKAVRYSLKAIRDYMVANTVKPTVSGLSFYPPIMVYGEMEVDFFSSINLDADPTGYRIIHFTDELLLSSDAEAKIAQYLDGANG